ncbi:hypothetical protein ACN4EG_16680 [Alkalinema pantanalense CENA528]|uniref:hypothetical protein n=1 Tax=Alkalinema pantanalense TaxID=1620705 RepID=UPI003D6F6191
MKSLTYYSSNRKDEEALQSLEQSFGASLEHLPSSDLIRLILSALGRYQFRRGLVQIPPSKSLGELLTLGKLLDDLSLDGLLTVVQTAIDQLKSDRPE